MKTIYDLKNIAERGGNLIVDGTGYTMYDLRAVAAACKESEVSLTINYADKFSSFECGIIAGENPGRVTFNFCK